MYINSSGFLRSRHSLEYQFMQIKDVPRLICGFFSDIGFFLVLVAHLVFLVAHLLKLLVALNVDINHFSSAVKLRICELTD